MNVDEDPAAGHDESERFVAQTLLRAGARTAAPPGMSEDVEREVARAWRSQVRGRARRRVTQRIAAGFIIACAGLLAWKATDWLAVRPHTAGILVASKGPVEISGMSSPERVTGGQALPDGATINTAEQGHILLALGSLSLRIGGGSRVRMVDAHTLELTRGAVYLDSNNVAQSLIVDTPFGRIEHAGTQYQARVTADQLTVGVRQGMVRVAASSGPREVSERQQLRVSSNGAVQLTAIAPFGEFWRWTEDVRPDFPIEGQTLSALFRWYTQETGHPIRFADDFARAQSETTRISGSISDLSPPEALQAVLSTTRFNSLMQSDGTLVIGLPREARDKLLLDGAESPQVPRLDPDSR